MEGTGRRGEGKRNIGWGHGLFRVGDMGKIVQGYMYA
jgi:hypothetical protein